MSFPGRLGALRRKARARPGTKLPCLGLVVVASFLWHIGHTHRDVSPYLGVSSAFSSSTTSVGRVTAKHVQQVSGVGEDFIAYPVHPTEPEKVVNGNPYEMSEILFPWLNVRGTSTSSVDSWTSSAPALVPDIRAFKLREMPFDGCAWNDDDPPSCVWPASTAVVTVYEVISLPPRKTLGVCGTQGKPSLNAETATTRVNDERVFVPLDISQSSYFAHFMDCLMPKLVYALELRAMDPVFFSKLLIFLPGNFASQNTYAALKSFDVEWTHTYPDAKTVFKAVLWTCHTPPMSPRQGDAIRRVFNTRPRKKCSGAIAYASRTPRTTRNGRHIKNDDKVIEALSSFNRTLHVFQGTEPISWLRDRLAETCVLVGEHGTAMYNMVWLPNDAYVIELDGFKKYTVVSVLANVFGLKYAWLNHVDTPNEVDPERLKAIVMRAISGGGNTYAFDSF